MGCRRHIPFPVLLGLCTCILWTQINSSQAVSRSRSRVAKPDMAGMLLPAEGQLEDEKSILDSAKSVKVFLAQDETWPPFREAVRRGGHAKWTKFTCYGNETGYGAKITPQEVVAFGEDHVHRQHLHGHSLGILAILASRGWLFRTDEYDLGGLFMHRLRRSRHRAEHVRDADFVVNNGCGDTYDSMFKEQTKLIHQGKMKHHLPQFSVVGTSFVFPLKWIMASKCSKDNWRVVFDNAQHKNPIAFRVPYPTIVHTTGGALVSDMEFIFEFHDRPNLLSFYGTIQGSVALTRARKRFVSKLVAGRHEASLEMAMEGTPLKSVFTFPFVILPKEVIVQEADMVDAVPDEHINRLDRKKEFGQLFGFALYAESQFCLQPPGDAAMRRGVYDSIIAGCIPVIYSHTVGRYASMFNGLVYRTLGIKASDVFWIIDPNTDTITLYKDMIDAVKSGETTRRRKLLAKVADYFHYAYEDNDKDAFLMLMESMHRYALAHGTSVPPEVARRAHAQLHNQPTSPEPITTGDVDASEQMEEGGEEVIMKEESL